MQSQETHTENTEETRVTLVDVKKDLIQLKKDVMQVHYRQEAIDAWEYYYHLANHTYDEKVHPRVETIKEYLSGYLWIRQHQA